MRRRVALVLAAMALALLLASGVALAVNKIGTDGPDTLRGTNGPDNLSGRGGSDRIFSLAGKDNLLGGPGKDILLGGSERRAFGGDKNLDGGPGNDVISGGQGSDNALGGDGNDQLAGNLHDPSSDKHLGGDGNDVVFAVNRPAVRDVVVCGRGFDRVLVDRKDVVAPDCEKVWLSFGSADAFFESIPQSFWTGLPQV